MTLLLVVSLLFSQLALANYVCPAPALAVVEVTVMQMGSGEPCDLMGAVPGKAMDPDQPVLCHQHCVDAAASFDVFHAPVASLPAVVQILPVPYRMEAGSAGLAHALRERPPPDPLFLSTLRLRV